MDRQEFGNAALGCPQPGEAAADVVTPGYKVVLSTRDGQYELHTNLDGTLIRCLPAGKPVVDIPDFTTPDATTTGEPEPSQPGATSTPFATPEDEEERTAIDTVADALVSKDYEGLRETISGQFWLGFFASEASQIKPAEAIKKLEEIYLGPGLVRVHPDVSVEKLLPDWTGAAPYARFVYSTGWGESQQDDAILLFEEQADTLYWAGMFYIFDGLKAAAYGDQAAQLPAPASQRLGAITNAIEGKDYDALESLATTPVFLGFYASEASPLSPEAFVEALQRDYLEPGEVKVRFDVDVGRLLPDFSAEPPCDDLLYSTGWGEEQADDGILCLRDESGTTRLGGLLYVFEPLKETAYAEQPPEEGAPAEFEGMVYVPAGSFLMGSSASDIGSVQGECQRGDPGCNLAQFEDETPQREVTLSAYYIDETEVTMAQFKEFVAATGYRTTSESKGDAVQYTWRAFDIPERQDHPVRWMTWHDANAFCQWAGKRLPTEAEWEKAARGEETFKYPWGNVWDEARVPRGDTAPVNAFPNGASPYGALGMAGGVWEWVYDWYDPFYYQGAPTVDPTGPGETRDKVLRGGAFGNGAYKHRTAFRHFGGATGYSHDHGFRCAKDPESNANR
jgi:formylglycine-generating enzyme required for sulfatase activity